MRVLGAMLIVCATGYIGVTQALTLNRRVQVLRAIESALELLKNEISGSMTPLPEACKLVSLSVAQPVAGLFEALSLALQQPEGRSVQSLLRQLLQRWELPLEKSETQALLDLSAALGRYDVEGQLRALNLASARFAAFAVSAGQDRRDRGRACGVLGICAGVALVILLV